jgi:tripartite ATP-independent transporter DctM subunit
MEPEVLGIIGTLILLVLIFVGVHIAIALGVVGLAGLVILTNLDAALSQTAHVMHLTASSYALSVVPLFILMGYFAGASGVVIKAYGLAEKWLSNLRGGMYLVTTGSCAMFAAAVGEAAAGVVAIGRIVLPIMKERGYNQRLSVGCVAASGTLGVLIPPSFLLVVYGVVVEESIGKLLLAGIMPGVLSAAIYMLGMLLLVRIRPSLGPSTASFGWNERLRSIPGVWGIVLLFGIVMGGIYTGVFTPTEAGAIGALAAMVLLAFDKKGQFFGEVKHAAWGTLATNVMLFFIIMAAMVFTRFMVLSGVTDSLEVFIFERGLPTWLIVTFFILLCMVLGMFMSATAALLLTAPIAYAALIPLGFNGIWLGIIMVKMFELAAITPPVGINVFIAKSLVPEMRVEAAFLGALPFMIMDVITVIILITFPQISLWLPTMAIGG